MRLVSTRNANTLLMRMPGDLKIASVSINGRSHTIRDSGETGAPWLVRFNAPPPEGIDLELHFGSDAPFSCWLGDRSFGLPLIGGRIYPPRPAAVMPTYGSDVTLVTRRYKF